MAELSKKNSTLELPVLPLKNSVVFPHVVTPLSVGRELSMAAVEAAIAREDKHLVVIAQRNPEIEAPGTEDLFTVGTKVFIRKMVKSSQSIELLVQGIERLHLEGPIQIDKYISGAFQRLPMRHDQTTEVEALERNIFELTQKIDEIGPFQSQVPFRQMIQQLKDPAHKVYLLASLLGLDLDFGQKLLEAPSLRDLLSLFHDYLAREVEVFETQAQIASKAASEIGKQNREYVLRQQMRAIQKELGESDPHEAEVQELRDRVEKTELPELVRTEIDRELDRLTKIPNSSPEFQVSRSYIEFVVDLPWKQETTDNLDLHRARTILDEDHYDIKEVKERIVEHLAVMKLNPEAKSPILCFVGPPGVGKTSLGQSIARSLGRHFERMSLGGMHDEAELRGHRRTYIGAMPGRILQAIRRSKARNPVIMLDEVDKLGRDFRGDPAAALLEILDPQQNFEFRDNYLDLPYDLTHVFFITTANTLDTIPRPLLDRMEVLRLSGYSDEEKMEIAKRYLIPRQIRETGLKPTDIRLDDTVLLYLIRNYTREAGVRELERVLGRIFRKIATRFADGIKEVVDITIDSLASTLGPKRFFSESFRKELPAGVATGLAWTEAGGDVLYIETVLTPEVKVFDITGQLGDVMKESAKAAKSFIWSICNELGVPPGHLEKVGLHVHVPAGAIPKDGPSAGITIATALASLITGLPVRTDVAMTGEITLTGLVMPIGGVKEKVLAARRSGITKIILPRENLKDLEELPEVLRDEMTFYPVDNIREVLGWAIPDLARHLAA